MGRIEQAEELCAGLPIETAQAKTIAAYHQDRLLEMRLRMNRTIQNISKRKTAINDLREQANKNLWIVGSSIGLPVALWIGLFAYDLMRHPWWEAVISAAIRTAFMFISMVIYNRWEAHRLAREEREKSALILPPGDTARLLLAVVMTPQTMERVIDPHLADMRHDWLEAMIRGDEVSAQRIRREGYVFLAQTAAKRIFLDLVAPFFKRLFVLAKILHSIWKYFFDEDP